MDLMLMLRSGQSAFKVINVGDQNFKIFTLFCDLFMFDWDQRAIPRYHLPIAPTYSHQWALQGGQRSSGLSHWTKKLINRRNSPNKIPREESMRRASLIHPEKQFLRRSGRLFNNQTSRATSTLLSGQLVVDNSIKMYLIASAMSVAPQDCWSLILVLDIFNRGT